MKKIVFGMLAMVFLFGCSSSSVVEEARLLGTKQFTPKAWAEGNREQRAEMVFSFLSQHTAASLSAVEVRQLLGEPTGYYDYDENPAYIVGPDSVESPYGKGYLLAFVADKSNGRITDVKIIPEPR
ncbi:hypothetical protein [Denitromonas ohlonensis]|uniref:DUF3192 domain-containing protein n=2 Tax=Denitromonas TaxID=139331 RepID=A0A557RC03_9RHOO|nr:hypothetical protein [Denitromonas ohlonensis]TVO62699.1 hypothetical protein FHP90_16925 [Denitromonas ohlonensis]TVO78904.1 hypothetical protein FHP89_04410 [Denitromonas ohlonensis]